MKRNYDFSGWATKNDLRCADGRTIRRNAFKEDDGRVVPLVWMHQHNDPDNVLGHALLKNENDGVYAYCSLNDGYSAKQVRELLRHGDVCSLSIWANNLTQDNGDVLHGSIKEVSVVLSGANPGAIIDYPTLAHGEESTTECYVCVNEEIELDDSYLAHANKYDKDDEYDEDDEDGEDDAEDDEDDADSEEYDENTTVQDVIDGLNDEQRDALEFLIGMAIEARENGGELPDEVEHADTDEHTVQDVVDTLDPTQRKVFEYLIGLAYSGDADDEEEPEDGEEEPEDEEYDEDDEDERVRHYDDEGEEFDMRHNPYENVFDAYGQAAATDNILTHDQMTTIIEDAKQRGSLREAVLAHADEYGIDQIDWLFPEYKNLNNPPDFVKRDTSWVNTVMSGVNHSPVSRIKSTFADITEEEARARGYIKGDKKKAEVFSLLRRKTDPQTIYKLQTLDRDDQIDITDFDVVAWIKNEMRTMLDEELARAFLVGDGRDPADRNHISHDHVRPVYTDDDLFVIRRTLTVVPNEEKAATLIDTVVKAFEDYEGSDNTTMFTTKSWRSDMLLLKDGIGHRIYKTDTELASAMLVGKIETVPAAIFDSVRREANGVTYKPVAIILNLKDYMVGADKGGSVNMFEDFDIKFNQNNYLIETRCSSALTKPYSAIVIEEIIDNPLTGFAVTPEEDTETVLGETVSDLQTGVNVGASRISGTLHHVTGFTNYSNKPAEQEGNYIALRVDTDTASDVITAELIGGTGGVKTLTEDRNVVFRITSPLTQKIRIIASNGTETITKTYSLTNVKLES